MDEKQAERALQGLLTRVNKEPTTGTNALSARSKECSDIVADWVTLCEKMYPQQEWDEGLILAYRTGLEHLAPQLLHLAFRRAMRDSPSSRRGFRPSVGEICEAAELERENLPEAKSQRDPDCPLCSGTGWKPSEAGNKHSPHVPCGCQAEQAAGSGGK